MKTIVGLLIVWLYIGCVKAFAAYCRVKNKENESIN